jgi:Prolyl oligopeptidase family
MKIDAATGEALPLFDAAEDAGGVCRPPPARAEDVERVPTGADPRDRRRRAMGRFVEVLGARISHRERELDAKGSVLAAAKNLHGVPLLIHGVIDETVHAQNTLKLSYELQRAGKPFRLMMYEKSRHGRTDAAVVKHMRQMMFDFTLEMLGAVKNGPTNTVR